VGGNLFPGERLVFSCRTKGRGKNLLHKTRGGPGNTTGKEQYSGLFGREKNGEKETTAKLLYVGGK